MKSHSKDALQIIKATVNNALNEDMGPKDGNGDVTAAAYNINKNTEANVICREAAILCGQQWFTETFQQLDNRIQINWQLNDGEAIEKDAAICTVIGSLFSLFAILLSISKTASTADK